MQFTLEVVRLELRTPLWHREVWPRGLPPKAILLVRITIQIVPTQTEPPPKGGRHLWIQVGHKMELDRVDQNQGPKLEASRPNRKKGALMQPPKAAALVQGQEEHNSSHTQASSTKQSWQPSVTTTPWWMISWGTVAQNQVHRVNRLCSNPLPRAQGWWRTTHLPMPFNKKGTICSSKCQSRCKMPMIHKEASTATRRTFTSYPSLISSKSSQCKCKWVRIQQRNTSKRWRRTTEQSPPVLSNRSSTRH